MDTEPVIPVIAWCKVCKMKVDILIKEPKTELREYPFDVKCPECNHTRCLSSTKHF